MDFQDCKQIHFQLNKHKIIDEKPYFWQCIFSKILGGVVLRGESQGSHSSPDLQLTPNLVIWTTEI